MKLPIDHIMAVRAEIEISDTCPGCRADLTRKDALLCVEYQDQARPATKAPGQELSWGEHLPKSLDSTLYLCWECANCHHELTETHETHYVSSGVM